MINVYTDDQGNTYTILQLCKKVLKNMKDFGTLTIEEGEHFDETGTPSVSLKQEDGKAILVFDYMKGATGEKGDKGDTGPQGPQGESGITVSVPYVGQWSSNSFNFDIPHTAIPQTGLCVIMFNTTAVIVPYDKSNDTRFCCNAIYDSHGNSMVARCVMRVDSQADMLMIRFDDTYVSRLSIPTMPYCIVKFLSF